MTSYLLADQPAVPAGHREPPASLQRWSSSSDPFCTDLFGAHLHTPLAAAELV